MVRLIGMNSNLLTDMVKNEKVFQYIQLGSLLLIPWGLFFFEAMASILVITFAIPLLFFARTLQWESIRRYVWPFFLIYGILLVSGFWSANTERWLSLLRVNLPYIFLPLAFFLWPEFLGERRHLFQQQFIFAGVVLSLYLGVYFILHMNEVLLRIAEGGFFPVPVHHVRTSLFLALSGLFCWDEVGRRRRRSKGLLLYSGFLLVLILGIHLLAVRTGLLLFYAGTILTLLLNKNFHSKRGIFWLVTLVMMMAIAILFIPTLHEKWTYFQEDIRNYDSASWWFYSDAVRWKSNVIGWEIARSAPWWGVGIGDVLEEVHFYFYQQEHIRIWEYPHNLWITFLAGSGVVGFALLNLALTRLFQVFYRHTSIAFIIIFIIYLISCLVENTLLTSLGSISFVIITLLAIGNDSEDSAQVFAGKAYPEQN